VSWEPFQEPTGPYTGPYVEYSASTPATGPQMPPYAETGAQWNMAAPQQPVRQLSLWEAVKQLPAQYWRVLSKPGTATFAWEAWKARWDVIWVQVLGLSLFSAVLTMLFWLIFVALVSTSFASFPSEAGSSNYAPGLGFLLVPVPLIGLGALISGVGSFFLGEGIAYGLAKAFGGQGDFKTQAYTSLLYHVPINIVALLLSLVPFVGSIGSLIGIYAYVLEVFQQMAIHRLSVGRALAVVLIPVGVGLLLAVGVIILYFYLIFSLLNAVSVPQ
jgi:hypothetical protein